MLGSLTIGLALAALLGATDLAEEGRWRRSPYVASRDINKCPSLAPRPSGKRAITDLRPDDICALITLGDSDSAAANAYPGDIFNLTGGWINYKLISHGGGAQPGAPTWPNFFARYGQPKPDRTGLGLGGAPGQDTVPFCGQSLCNVSQVPLDPAVANLNAALTGATTADLPHELEYIYEQVTPKQVAGWKVITISIGALNAYEDGCTCDPPAGSLADPVVFEAQLRAVLEDMRCRLPNSVVYFERVPDVAINNAYVARFPQCVYSQPVRDLIFPCGMCDNGLSFYSYRTGIMNDVLAKVAHSYSVYDPVTGDRVPKHDNFAVVLLESVSESVPGLDIDIDFFSTFDCGHASVLGQELVAAAYWNEMFDASVNGVPVVKMNTPLYCPRSADRLKVVF